MFSFDNSRVHGYRLEGGQYSMRQALVQAGRFFDSAPLPFALEAKTKKGVHPEGIGRHVFHQISQVNPLRVVQGCSKLMALLHGFGPDFVLADVTVRYAQRCDNTTHMGVSLSINGTINESYEMYRIAIFIASVFQHINNLEGVWFRYHEPTEETVFIGINYAGFDLRYDQAWALRHSRLILSMISRYLMQVVASTDLSKEDVMDLFSEFTLQNLALRSYHGRGNVQRWLPQGLMGASRSVEDFLFSSCVLSLGFDVQGDTVPLPFVFADMVRRHVNRKMDVLFYKGYFNVNFVQRQTIRTGLTSTVLDRIVEQSVAYTLIIPMLSTIRVRFPDSLDKEFFKHFGVNVQADRVSVYLSPTQDLVDWQRAAQIVNVLIALYPDATIDGALAGVPPVGAFLDPEIVHPNVTFNMVLDRAWYNQAGLVAVHLPANIQAVLYQVYTDAERKYFLNDMIRAVQNWLLAEIHQKV